MNIIRSCGVNTVAGCTAVPGLSPWSVERHDRRCLLTAGPLQGSDSGAWECHLTQYGVSESTIAVTRQDLTTLVQQEMAPLRTLIAKLNSLDK